MTNVHKYALVATGILVGTWIVGNTVQSAFALPKVPALQGQTTATPVNLDQVIQRFESEQGLAAGKTPYENIDIDLDQRLIKYIPAEYLGNCGKLRGAKGSVTFTSSFNGEAGPSGSTKTDPTTGQQTVIVTLPDPQPISAGLFDFTNAKVKEKKRKLGPIEVPACGGIAKQDLDAQAMNDQALREVCKRSASDTTSINDRRNDAAKSAEKLFRSMGYQNPLEIHFSPSGPTRPSECPEK